MTKQKYTITDDAGQEVGFVLIEQSNVFEYSTPSSLTTVTDGPIADVALLLGSLVGFTGVAWFIPGPSWLAPTVGVGVTAILAALKAWRSGPARPDEPGQSQELTIKLESWSDEGSVLLDEVQDKTIDLETWRKAAKAIVYDGRNFSRPALQAYISQGDYHKIKAELTRLNMAHKQGNGYTLSPRGLAFLRKVHTLPH